MAELKIAEITSMNDIADMEKAKQIANTLVHHYPGHPWAVSWQGGVCVVKNLAISDQYGFIIKHADSFSSSDLAHKAVLAGGELLERAKMKRGFWNGERAKELEGSEPRFFH